MLLAFLAQEVHLVHPNKAASKVPKNNLKKKLIFHDGRFVRRPTPLHVAAVLLWLPFGLLLFLLRSHLFLFLPTNLFVPLYRLLGVEIIVRGRRPPPPSSGSPGSILAANHRNFMDAVAVSFALGRMLSTTSTSLGQYARLLSPLPLMKLTRNRDVDRDIMADHLRRSDFIIFPEGTTCREPYVLRCSKLFAELGGRIVPVAIKTGQSWLHGTSTRGWKGMDLLFLFSNPWVQFEVTFLEALPEKPDVGGGEREREAAAESVANYVQKVVAEALGYEASRLSRKDKHKLLLES